jgi:branched-chain amino acid transport system permease protein
MAALGGGLGAEFLGLDPQYPLKYLVLFLIVVAVGGVGRITGVFYAALIIGVLDFALKSNVLNLLLERLGGDSVLVRVLSGTMTYLQRGSMLFIYLLTILLLLWRPRGLFGKAA